MHPTFTTTTKIFKLIYFAFLSIISIIVISGSFLMLDDPRFKTPSLVTNLKRLYYSTSFFSANALGATVVGNTTVDSNSPAHSIPILVYHGVLSESDMSSINLTESQFKDQMFALKRAGFTTISTQELYEFAKEGKTLPSKPVLITFDDGRADSFYNADPILDAVNFSAVMFVITDYTHDAHSGGYYLSTDEIRHIARTGRWEIGSHSANGHDVWKINEQGDVGNFFSHNLWNESEKRNETEGEFLGRITEDYRRSKLSLEELLGTTVQSFAYPFGDLGQNSPNRERMKTIENAASAFYTLLFYQQRPGEYYTQFTRDDRQKEGAVLVRRINIQNTWDADTLLDILSDGEQKKLPYNDNFETDNGWIRLWSEVVVENNLLTLESRSDSSGASTILDGTQLWTDYVVTANVSSPNRTGVVIWTRFQNEFNNASCNFGTDFVFAEQTIDGEKRVLKGVERPNSIPEGEFTLTARVMGRTLICSINGMEIVQTEFLEPELTHGGIGVKIWDKELGKSSVSIRQLSVEPINSEE